MDYSPWAQDPCIMFVDSDAGHRSFARNVLEREGFKVLTARNSVEALVLAADYPFSIDVLVTEGGMRVYQNGLALAECFGILRPETRVILTTEEEAVPEDDLPGSGRWPRIAKPFTAGLLADAVAQALDLSPVLSSWTA